MSKQHRDNLRQRLEKGQAAAGQVEAMKGDKQAQEAVDEYQRLHGDQTPQGKVIDPPDRTSGR